MRPSWRSRPWLLNRIYHQGFLLKQISPLDVPFEDGKASDAGLSNENSINTTATLSAPRVRLNVFA